MCRHGVRARRARSWGGVDELKLHGSFGLLLDHDGAIPNATAGNNVTDANLDHVATAQLAVDREVEERSIS